MAARPLALITGASRGIGAALADALAERGYDLVLIARRRDRLEEVAARAEERGATAEVLTADLATEEGLAAAAERTAHGDLRLLVSNAGVGGYGPFSELSAADLDGLWRLNATTPITLAHAALPSMLERGQGGIVTVASLLAFSSGLTNLGPSPMPPRTLYASAKSATVTFTRALAGELAGELAGTGVNATVVCPGRVATEWSGGANKGQPGVMSAEDVATAIAVAAERGETICVPGLPDPDAVERLREVERTLLVDGNRSELAERYRSAGR